MDDQKAECVEERVKGGYKTSAEVVYRDWEGQRGWRGGGQCVQENVWENKFEGKSVKS